MAIPKQINNWIGFGSRITSSISIPQTARRCFVKMWRRTIRLSRSIVLLYTDHQLIASRIIESAAYCNQIMPVSFLGKSAQIRGRLFELFGYCYHFYVGLNNAVKRLTLYRILLAFYYNGNSLVKSHFKQICLKAIWVLLWTFRQITTTARGGNIRPAGHIRPAKGNF
jgi:hypothetical protein